MLASTEGGRVLARADLQDFSSAKKSPWVVVLYFKLRFRPTIGC